MAIVRRGALWLGVTGLLLATIAEPAVRLSGHAPTASATAMFAIGSLGVAILGFAALTVSPVSLAPSVGWGWARIAAAALAAAIVCRVIWVRLAPFSLDNGRPVLGLLMLVAIVCGLATCVGVLVWCGDRSGGGVVDALRNSRRHPPGAAQRGTPSE